MKDITKTVKYIVEPCPGITYAKLRIQYYDDNNVLINKVIGVYLKLSTCLIKAHLDFDYRFKNRKNYKFMSICKFYDSYNSDIRDLYEGAFNEYC